MKKGCFIKSIIILTILVAAIAYIVRHRFNELILLPGRYFISKGLNENMDYIKPSPEKDSLKILIRDYVTGLKHINKTSSKSIEAFADSLRFIVRDSVINKDELNQIKEIIKRQAEK